MRRSGKFILLFLLAGACPPAGDAGNLRSASEATEPHEETRGTATCFLHKSVVGCGGILAAASSAYLQHATAGQTLLGNALSANYGVVGGFWQVPSFVTGTGPGLNAPVPSVLVLYQNYPNPFNPTTTIRFGLPGRARVMLSVYNTLGQEIERLADGDRDAGYYDVVWNAGMLASGVYFYRLHVVDAGATGDGSGRCFVETRRLLLVR